MGWRRVNQKTEAKDEPSFSVTHSQPQKCHQKDQESLGWNKCGREFGTAPAEDEGIQMMASQGQQLMAIV